VAWEGFNMPKEESKKEELLYVAKYSMWPIPKNGMRRY